MIKCPKCGLEQEDGAKFCEGCGASLADAQPQTPAKPEPAEIFCPNCGEKTSADAAFCDKCGASLALEPAQPAAAILDVSSPSASIPQPPKKQGSKKWIPIIAAAAVVVVAVGLAVSMFSGGGGKSNIRGMYLKDKEISYTTFSKAGPMEVTSRLANGEDLDNEDLADAAVELASFITFCKGGELLFYPDRVEADGMVLYCRNLKKPAGEPTRIDSGVQNYAVNEAGTTVVYLKDSSIYRSDLTDKEKIASDITRVWVAGDCQSIAYLDDEDNLYLWKAGEKEKLASDVESMELVKDDLSVFYYMKEDALYRQIPGGNREKIAGDVDYVSRIYDSGEIFFVRSEDITIDLMDYVRDDLAGDDAAMTEPQSPSYPSYPSRWAYSTTEEYQAAVAAYQTALDQYQTDYAEYQTAYQLYRDKLQRDRLREQLEDASMDRTQYTLCFYNGAEVIELTSSLRRSYDVTTAAAAPVALVPVYEQEEVSRVKFSEIEDVYALQSQVEEALYSSTVYCLVKDGELTKLDLEEPYSFRLKQDGSQIAYLSDVNTEKARGDLFTLDLSGKEPDTSTLYDSDVSTQMFAFLPSGSLRYYKDVSENDYNYKGDLYIDKVQVDYDVQVGPYRYDEDTDTYYYFTEWNNDKSYGTLNTYQAGKSAKIAEDVTSFCPLADQSILYLYDYSTKNYRGTLARFKNGESEKVDEDVTAILEVASRTGGKGGTFYAW